MASLPIREYHDPDAIRARIRVLREKATRILSYNESLDPAVLDEKQLGILARCRREPGIDRMPDGVLGCIGWTIDRLHDRLRCFERTGSWPTRPIPSPRHHFDGRRAA